MKFSCTNAICVVICTFKSPILWLSFVAGPNLKIVAAMSAGYDNINVGLLKSKGIQVSNTPDVLSNAVAELAISLLLSAARRLNEGYRAILE